MAELLPHQEIGARFLAARHRALLADEQRVGKTPTSIRACDYTGLTSVLVLCPSIARQNWLREFERFSKRTGKVIATRKDNAHPSLTICSYDLLIHQSVYKQIARPWGAVILDESHFLKSDPSEAKRSDAAWKIAVAARYCWALSGTPAPNHAGELYQLLRHFNVIGCSYWQFIEFYCRVSNEGKVVGNKNVEALRKLLEPIMLRRLLKDVAPDMPPIQWSTVMVEPGPVSAEQLCREVAKDHTTALPADAKLAAMKQGKALAERLQQAQAEIDQLDPRDSLWFRRYCGLQKIQPVVELVRSEFDNGMERIVIFGWHRDVLAAIAQDLEGELLYGGTSDPERNRIIDGFRDGEIRVVCAQILTAGTAIDLSAADDVLFVEQDWTPSNNAQAAMRVMSQFKKRPVRARAVGIAGSIDEAVTGTLQRKTRMVAEILN